ncbi:SseB family protein [Catenulispora rubra]|uniref:SseB family protein n=1 Tax=Catenulispora rubra TaxID=280293 RepID=UPI00189210BE|nr:SseB family protein [Catenulispora rubra]
MTTSGFGRPADSWKPANAVEESMARAAAAGDSAAYFRLVESATLYLPGSIADRQAGMQRFATRVIFGHTYVLAFTSVDGLMAHVAEFADASVATSYEELRRHWPDPGWRLAVNPGTPVDAYVRLESVAEAARGAVHVTTVKALAAQADADLSGSGEAPHELEAALAEAIRTADVDAYVHRLLGALVLVPTTAPVDGPARILEAEFPWRITGGPESPGIEVFTSRAAFTRAFPQPVPYVVAAFRFVLTAWPEGCGLAVDPDSPSGISLSPEILQMLQLWPTSGWAAQ